MKYFLIILTFECRYVLRTPVMLLSLLAFIGIGCLALYNGHRAIGRQQAAIDSLLADYDVRLERVLTKFHPRDTSAQAKQDSAYAGMAVMVNFRLPQPAVNPPSAAAFMALGQRDVYPYFVQVRTSVDYLDTSNAQIANPVRQRAGHFDLAFSFIHLFPLLIIAWCYNLSAQERALGTYQLLRLYDPGIKRVIGLKFLARGTFLLLLSLLLNGIALAMSGFDAIGQVLAFFSISLLYLIFWLAVCYVIAAGGKDAGATALRMLAAWILLVIVLPALANSLLRLSHPVPLQADIASYKRQASESIWNTNQDTLVKLFLDNNPEFRKYYRAEVDKRPWGDWAIAGYYDLLARKVHAYAEIAGAARERRMKAEQAIVFVNPVTFAQELFVRAAGTSMRKQRLFDQRVMEFQKEWRNFLYHYQLTGTDLKPEDFEKFPQFKL